MILGTLAATFSAPARAGKAPLRGYDAGYLRGVQSAFTVMDPILEVWGGPHDRIWSLKFDLGLAGSMAKDLEATDAASRDALFLRLPIARFAQEIRAIPPSRRFDARFWVRMILIQYAQFKSVNDRSGAREEFLKSGGRVEPDERLGFLEGLRAGLNATCDLITPQVAETLVLRHFVRREANIDLMAGLLMTSAYSVNASAVARSLMDLAQDLGAIAGQSTADAVAALIKKFDELITLIDAHDDSCERTFDPEGLIGFNLEEI